MSLGLSGVITLIALALDELLGEPARFHPLVGFGNLAKWLESRLNVARSNPVTVRLTGALAVALLILPFACMSRWIPTNEGGVLINALILYWAIGRKSLQQHARRILAALLTADVGLARQRIGMIVSRQTEKMTAPDIARASVESVLENGNDAVFGAIFWFFVAGAPGVIMFRLANTLDAMWGYRNARFLYFGWAAAKLDDVLNWLPARATAFAYALAGQFRAGLEAWKVGAPQWDSPNAGPVMAAGAGSLGVTLGGPACYEGKIEQRPWLGGVRAPGADDIARSLRLIDRALVIWLMAAAVLHFTVLGIRYV